jgi:hypothetical protein
MTRSIIDIRDTTKNEFVVNPDSKQPALFASDCLIRAYLREVSGNTVPLLFTPTEIANARNRAKTNPEDVRPLASKWKRILSIICE